MWRKLLYSGFHTPKAVTYHEPTVMWLFMIGHSLGRMETRFGPSTQGAGIRYQNTSQIQILQASHLEKKKNGGAMLEFEEFEDSRITGPWTWFRLAGKGSDVIMYGD